MFGPLQTGKLTRGLVPATGAASLGGERERSIASQWWGTGWAILILLKDYEWTNRERGKREGRKEKEKGKGKKGRGERQERPRRGEKEEKGNRKGRKGKGNRGPGNREQSNEKERQGTEREGEEKGARGREKGGRERRGKGGSLGRTWQVQSAVQWVQCFMSEKTSHHITSQAKIKSCKAAQYRIMVMAHSGMREYKRVSNSAPLLVQCNVFWKTHIHILEESWKWKHWTSTSTVFQSVPVACNKVEK